MSTLRPDTTKRATTSGPKIVASAFETDRLLRLCLAGMLRFVRVPRVWPPIEGNLSSWILSMHGLGDSEYGEKFPPAFPEEDAEAVSVLSKLYGPATNKRQVHKVLSKCQDLFNEKGPKLAEAYRTGNMDAFNSLFSDVYSEVLDTLAFPESFSRHLEKDFVGFVKTLRATRATLVCTTLFGEHPIVLIARASDGDRRAVLELIKTDKMFLNDRCCTDTIRRAELQDDRAFIEQIARALKYEPKVRCRDLLHLYYFSLFLFEQYGASLPTLSELWRTVDHFGRHYESLAAFERDFQRRRLAFVALLENVETAYNALSLNKH